MNISNDCVATIHYTLKNDAGEIVDSSIGEEPLHYLHGAQNIVIGLENALAGKTVGDKLSVVVAPAEAYGEHNSALIQAIPRDMFSGIDTIEVGMAFHAQTQYGMQEVEVTKIEGDTITVDGNHPFAGENLHFDVEVLDVREASKEEIDHGHAHGPGGHDH